ncbi:flagellar basal body P-ring formation chaperone FlgA [Poseidonocella sp. HB161398]|uniref:flagellar basal body P-ring formation chaperone FlgA n=1 Tax=Poseidonocella sp. HB161398 TaxID=2320855 RepID=UPI00110936EF|nr:flagellar basal body P-ring formation chaperone FlgA [Poseidonocella sp. HB161398]
MRILIPALLLAAALPQAPLLADVLVTARPVRAGTVLTPADLKLQQGSVGGAFGGYGDALGKQAVRNLYPGSPIGPGDIQEPHIVTRNQEVVMHFQNGGLSIVTEGRALDGGAAGDTIRVTNASSRKTVTGKVMPDGSVSVAGSAR